MNIAWNAGYVDRFRTIGGLNLKTTALNLIVFSSVDAADDYPPASIVSASHSVGLWG